MAPSASTPHRFTCVTCDLLIAGGPTFHVGLPFCCAGCVAGGPCMCSYDVDAHEGHAGGSEHRPSAAVRFAMPDEESAEELVLAGVR
jgi:hypothetical protein